MKNFLDYNTKVSPYPGILRFVGQNVSGSMQGLHLHSISRPIDLDLIKYPQAFWLQFYRILNWQAILDLKFRAYDLDRTRLYL